MADDFFYKQLKPKQYWGSDGVEAEHEREYESACVVLSQHTSRDPKAMTVQEFFATTHELNRQAEKSNR